MRQYIRTLRGLLRGEEVEWDGAVMQMLHPTGFAPQRPLAVPLLVGAQGPKGLAVAHEEADGLFTTQPTGGFPWVAHLLFGTVLEPGEDPGSARALAAAGHGAAVFYHATYENPGFGALAAPPGGAEWQRRVEQLPVRTRHLATHAQHMVALNDLDRGLVTGDVLVDTALILTQVCGVKLTHPGGSLRWYQGRWVPVGLSSLLCPSCGSSGR